MFRSAKKLALAATLAMLLQVTIVCDPSELEGLFGDLGFDVYYDDHDYHHHDDCWYDCDDEWFFDFDWW
jgi:hypothetical protein